MTGHVAELTTTTVGQQSGDTSPEFAFAVRRDRLRAARVKHTADPSTLTLSWVEDDHCGGTTTVTLTYKEA